MAESYRGLTIRIGGDTTSLQKALKTVNAATSDTDSALRKLSQALRLDPSNVQAMNLQMGYLADKAVNAGMKLAELRQAYEQTANREILLDGDDSPRKLSEIAEETENVAMRAAHAQHEFNTLTESLARMHTRMTDLANDATKKVADGFKDVFKNMPTDKDGEGMKALAARLSEIPDAIGPSSKAIKDFTNTYADQVKKWETLSDSAKKNLQKAFNKDLSALIGDGAKVYSDMNENTDFKLIADDLNQLKSILELSDDEVADYLEELKRLKDAFPGAKEELRIANLLQRMEDLRNETIKVEAMLKSTSQRLADMKAPSDVGKWLVDYRASLGVLTDEFSKFQSSVSTMGSVLKVDPTNTQAVAVALKSLSDASMNVDARIANVNEQLSKFDASKIEEASDYGMTAAQQLDEASKRASEADIAYGEAAGAVEQARSQLDQMQDSASKAALAIARGEEKQQEATDADQERAQAIVDLTNKMKGLEEARGRAAADKASADADLEVAKERAEYEALTQELYKLVDQQNKVSESARKMGQAYAEALGKASITDVISDSVQQSIDAVGRALESARSRAGSFGSIAKVDPTNIQSAQKYLDALADSENVAKLKVDELSKALSDIDASGLSRVKSEFGNTDNAVAQTKQRVAELFVELGKSRSDLDIAISAEGMNDVKEIILDLNEDLGEGMPESITKARNEVVRLEQAFDEAKAAEQEAARLNAFEGMQDSLAKTSSELDQMVVQRAQAIRDLVSDMQQAFSANLFASAGDGASVFDATLSRCRETISRVNAELAQSPGNVDLIAEREQAVAEATDALRAKAELLNNTFGGMDASAMDEVVSRYGSVEEAVRETAITAASARQQLADFDSEIEALAQGGEGWDWVESFKALKLDVEGVSEPVRELYERYVQLVQAAEQSDMDAAMASAAQEVAHLKSEAADARAALLEMARTNVGDEIRESLETAIGEMSGSIQNLASAFDTLKGHMGSYGELLKFDPGNAEAMSGYLQSIASAERVATLEMQNISKALSELDTSRLEEFRADFDTAGLAVKEISDVMNSTLIPAVEDARAELSAAISAEGLDEYRDAIMAVGEDVGVELPENVARLRDSLAEATRSFEEMKETAKAAAEAEKVEELRAKLASVAAELGNLTKARMDAANGLGESLQKTASATMFSGVNAQLKTFDDTFKRAKSTIDSVNKALEQSPRNAELLAQKEKAVETATSALDEKTKLLKSTLNSIDAKGIDAVVEKYKGVEQAMLGTQQRVSTTQKDLATFNTQISALASKLGDASWVDAFKRMELNVDECDDEVRELYSTFVRLNEAADDAKLEAVFASAANAAQSYQDQLDAIPRTLEGLGDVMKSKDQAAFMQGINMVSNWAERAGRQIIENANEIDTAYRNMRKTVDGTEEQFQKLYDSAIEFSKTHVTSADELLQMEALGGQVGIATDELERFAETASNLTIASDIDAEQAALSLGQMKNVLDLDIDGIERFSDSLVRLGNKMPATESSIMSVAQRIGSVATIAGMSASDILAWSAAIASTGQRSESAGTAISKTLTEIQSAVEGGGKKLSKFASVAGQSAEQFAASWKANPTTALKEFIDGLAGLDDAAITELENLGITGVRQKQALLGLAQTVENLDKALTESQSAWTVGGDAMEEARRKSEGFSGALQMLKNNLAAIWAEMAEGLDGPLNLIAQMLGTIAGVLNVLPTPLKMILSTVIAAGTSLGVVVNVLKVLSPMGVSLTAMISTLGEKLLSLPTSIQAFTTSLSGSIFEIGEATLATKALTIAAGSAMAAGIGVGIAAIAAIIDALVKWHEHNELVRSATEGLADAVSGSVEAINGYADGVASASRSVDEIRQANEEALQSVADLGEGIRDARQELVENESLVDAYANTIKELSGAGQLTSDQMEQLRNAVEKYNEITGAAIAITDEEHGTLNVIPGALDQITEAYKRNAEQKAKVSAYNSLLEEEAKVTAELAVANAELAKAEQEAEDKKWSPGTFGYGEAMMRAKELREEIEDLTRAQETLGEQAEVLGGEIESVESPITDLETLAVSLGYTLDQLASLSEDDMAKLKAAFQRSVPEAQRLLEQLMSTASGVSGSIATMSNLSKEEIKELAVEMKRVQEDAYTEYKRQLDAEYDAAKRARDAEYNDAKRAYDAIYNARKKELDNEYDAAKKAYDKIYDERKKSLDKEYDAVKKAYDKIYEAKKKEADASYDAAKKAYDKRYKEIKKGYDDEYDAAKKASDSYLKDFKKAQEEETKAFKKETDERIKAIDKEYEAKQKLIEDETDEAVAGVQGEIDDIKARKRARQVEKENRERERIAAELVENVNKAHTTKQREKAEKAYYDQIAEWEEEDLERREDAEIEALEAKKDALKDEQRRRLEVLKESRDAAVELYKNERDAQLELLQQAQQLEYDKQKELEEAKLETLKESHEQQLEMVKESNDAELAMIKASNDAALAGLKETNDAALTALKDQNDAILKNLKDQNDTALKSIKDNNDVILEGIKYANDDALRAIKESNDIALEGIKQQNEDALKDMKRVQEDELKNFKDTGVGFVTESMQAMQGIVDTVGTAVQSTGDKMKSLFEKGFGLENAGKNAMGSMAQGMADGAKDYLTPTVKGVFDLFRTPLENLNASVYGENYAASVASGITDGTNKYTVPALNGTFSLFRTPLENLATLGEPSGKAVPTNLANGIVSGTNEALVPSLNGMGTAVSSSMQGIGDGAEDQGKAVPYGAAKGINSGTTEALVPALNGVSNLVHGTLGGSEESAKIDGSNLMRSFAKAVADSSDVPFGVAEKVGKGMGAKVLKATIDKLGEHNSNLETSGANMIAGLNKGIVDTAQDKLIANVDAIARRINSAFKAAMGINSPSKVYMWFGQMMMSGLNMGIEQNADGTYRLVEDVSDGINRAFDPSSLDLSDVDLMQQLIDNMRSKEGALAAQAERMSKIVEDGFDPRMTVDAAFEAIDRIDTGKAARQQLVLEGSQQAQTAPVINMTNNWNGVTVRDETDIDRISAEFEKRMRRLLVSQIG